MSSARDFFTSSMADALLPSLKRSLEDVVYETLDQRQVPTRTDFKELRDQLNGLRGQLTGATAGVKKIAEDADGTADRIAALEARLADLDARLADLGAAAQADLPAELKRQIDDRLNALADDMTRRVAERLAQRLDRLEAHLSEAWLDAQLIRTRDEILGAVNPKLAARVETALLDSRLKRLTDEIEASAAAREAALRAEINELRSALSTPAPTPAQAAPAVEAPAYAANAEPTGDAHKGCHVPGCTSPTRSKGFCARHYQLWRRGRLDGFPLED